MDAVPSLRYKALINDEGQVLQDQNSFALMGIGPTRLALGPKVKKQISGGLPETWPMLPSWI
jgi:hypothetical protein